MNETMIQGDAVVEMMEDTLGDWHDVPADPDDQMIYVHPDEDIWYF